jgi:hypothetical protein
MLAHCKMILENKGGHNAINPDRFGKLITALRTAAGVSMYSIKKHIYEISLNGSES